jgi:hypothetical protein
MKDVTVLCELEDEATTDSILQFTQICFSFWLDIPQILVANKIVF